jgi:hypothetical protein
MAEETDASQRIDGGLRRNQDTHGFLNVPRASVPPGVFASLREIAPSAA